MSQKTLNQQTARFVKVLRKNLPDLSSDEMKYWTEHQEELLSTLRRSLTHVDLIERLKLSARPYTCLKQIGIRTIGELVDTCSERELLSLHGFGEKSLMEIKAKLEPLGLSLSK